MITMLKVERQLKRIGAGTSFKFFGRPEIRELHKILMGGETIQFCMNGRWEGGWAVLCVTDYRILLIDKKILFLAIEDIRYDMVVEVDYGYRFLDATMRICTPNKTLEFTNYKKDESRAATNYIQTRVMELRQMHAMQQEPVTQANNAGAVPMVSVERVQTEPDQPRPFLPKLPAKIMNPYTYGPLSVKRRVSRYQTQHKY